MTFGDDEKARRDAEAAAEFCRIHGFDADARTSSASAKAALLAEADEFGADVIVLGSSARKTLIRRMLGDTALHVIKNAQVPLFVCQ
jgi:nucleotide-binding universal stress UspA family protein